MFTESARVSCSFLACRGNTFDISPTLRLPGNQLVLVTSRLVLITFSLVLLLRLFLINSSLLLFTLSLSYHETSLL